VAARSTPALHVDEGTRRSLLELARTQSLSNEMVRRHLDVDRDEALRILRALTSEGLLKQAGAGAASRYSLDWTSAAWSKRVQQMGTPSSAVPPPATLNSRAGAEPAASGTLSSIETAFAKRLREDIETVIARSGYRPSYYLHLINTEGPVGAAHKLLAEARPQHGLEKLWEHGLLAYSLEVAVLAKQFRSLFSDREIVTARRRLEALEFTEDEAEPS
jgi:hypothetical protein